MDNSADIMSDFSAKTDAVVKPAARVILDQIDMRKLLEYANLLPIRDFRRMIIDINTTTGYINVGGAWLFAERMFGSIEGKNEEDLLLVAGGRYIQDAEDDTKAIPAIEVCAAVSASGDMRLLKAVKFEGDGSVVHGIVFDEAQLCSCLSALQRSVSNPAVYTKQLVSKVAA